MPKKIAFILGDAFPLPPVNGGAIESLLYALIKENEKYGIFQFIVYSSYNKEAKSQSETLKNTRVKYIKTKSYTDRALHTIYGAVNKSTQNFHYSGNIYINRIVKDLKDENPDVVVIQNIAIFSIIAKRDLKAKIVLHYHNLTTELATPYLNKSVLNSIDCFWGISDYVCKDIQKYGYNHGKHIKARIFYNCFDGNDDLYIRAKAASHFHDLMQEYNIKATDRLIIYAGRIQPYKGVKELIEAFLRIKRKNYKLIIAGGSFFKGSKDTPYIRTLKSITKSEESVVFTGYINHDDLLCFYHMGDIAVVPSLWEEPFALTCLEPMACARPVVISDAGGMVEVVDDKSALIANRQPDFISSLNCSIESLMSNDTLRESMGKAARKRSKLFTLTNYYQRFCELINELA